MEITRSAATEVQRCPYCHSSVGEAEEQVACKQCLARHHRACWDEGHRCASCSGTTPLVADVPRPAVISEVPRSSDEVRREASRLLDEAEHRDEGFAAGLLAYPTLGLYPIVTCEKALGDHARANGAAFGELPPLADDLKKRVETARDRAFAKKIGEGRHSLIALAYTGIGLALALGTMLSLLGSGRDADTGFTALLCAYWALQAILVTHLHAFREGVRRHEFDQFYARFVADAVSPARIKEVAEARHRAWSDRRVVDVVLSVLGFFASPLLLLPILALRERGALRLHMKHEESLLQTGGARKDTV